MGTPSEQASLLNVLPQEEFFVRHAEVQQLFHAGLDVSRSLQTSCFLRGKHKSGKTEILRRVYNKLFFEQDRVIVEAQRPEELPLDLSEELHLRGPDSTALEYRRRLRELGRRN